MNKTIKIITFLFMLISFLCLGNNEVHASSSVEVHFVVNEIKLNKKDELILNINISNLNNIKEIKLGINKNNIIEPILDKDGYFQINNKQFSKIYVNNIENNSQLRLHIAKETNYEETYQNIVTTIRFTCLEEIEDTINLFEDQITLYLFDSDNKLIDYDLKFSEKLKASWNILLNEIEVNSTPPDYTKCFVINNRRKEEYELIIEQNIDTQVLGMQAITIIVIDKSNKDYLVFNKAINVIDSTVPSITYPEFITIKDEEINNLIFEKYLVINDNYDLVPKIDITYYDQDKNIIETLDEMKKYLRTNEQGFISFYGIDSSNNKTDVIELPLYIKDTTSPEIFEKFTDSIYIIDTEIDNFNIHDYFEINDNYDLEPTFSYIIKNINTKEEVTDIINNLKEGNILEVEYFGIDKYDNKTVTKKTLIKVDDTQAPIIEGVSEVFLKDYEVDINNIIRNINYFDNIDKNPILYKKYYTNEIEISELEFTECIKKGLTGYIIFTVSDKSGNISDEFIQTINVLDTTAPTIDILDIKDGGKYLKLEEIKYEICDNFDGEIDVIVKLNENIYNKEKITEIGTYKFEIIAKDASGNQCSKIISFTIIENNIQGCGGDIDCYTENYTGVIVAVTVLMLAIVGVVIYKIISTKKKKKKQFVINE